MTEVIAFLSDKQNNGKTSLGINIASLLAKKGYLVTLVDLNFSHPSLYSYFNGEEVEKKSTINDFILGSDNPYLIVRLTSVIEKYSSMIKKGGDLFCIFADPKDSEMDRMEVSGKKRLDSVSRLIRLINYDLFDREFAVNKNCEYLGRPDFVILDLDIESIFWFTNGLSLIDTIFVTGQSELIATCNELHSWQVLEVFESHGKKMETYPSIPFHKDLYPGEFLTVLRYPYHEYSNYVESFTSRILSNKMDFE